VVEHDFPKLAQHSGGRLRIKNAPPLMFHLRGERNKAHQSAIRTLEIYRSTLEDHHRVLLDRFRLHDVAVKVVGVGSVGTLCMVALFVAADEDPLFLQIKQANASVLEPYAGKSAYPNHGQRVVMGQRLMQTASDHDAPLDSGPNTWTALLCAPAP
jgi:uncharacterized protein (DUF2252 family)